MIGRRQDRKVRPSIESLDERIAPSGFVAAGWTAAPHTSGFAPVGQPVPGHPGHVYGGAPSSPNGYPTNYWQSDDKDGPLIPARR